MKRLFLIFTMLSAILVGVNSVHARELDLINDVTPNSFIIGDRVYELNPSDDGSYEGYYLVAWDILSASAEYTQNHPGRMAHMYYMGGTGSDRYLIEYNGRAQGSTIPTQRVELTAAFPNGKIDATMLNGVPLDDDKYLEEVVNPEINAYVDELNSSIDSSLNVESVVLEGETVTFTFGSANDKLADLASDGTFVEFFEKFLGDTANATKASYTLGSYKEIDLTQNVDAASLAKEILVYLAGGNKDALELTYGDISNQNIDITLTFENLGNVYTETFNLAFVLNATAIEELTDIVNEEKNDTLTTYAEELNTLVEDPENETKYGFSDITYNDNDNTLTFTVSDENVTLETFKDSGIVDMYEEMINDATKVTYEIDGQSYEVDLSGDPIALALELFTNMCDDDSNLTLGAVKDKIAKATITYQNGVTIEYTLQFN